MRNSRELRTVARGVIVKLEQRHSEEFHILRDREDLYQVSQLSSNLPNQERKAHSSSATE